MITCRVCHLMDILSKRIGCLFVFTFSFVFSGVSAAQAIPIEAWIHDPVIDGVSLSWDGKKISALTLDNVNEAPYVSIWSVRDLSRAPKKYRPENSKLIAVEWLSENKLFAVGRQKFDYRIGGSFTKWFRDIPYIVDADTGRFRVLMGHRNDIQGASVVSMLPEVPGKVLIQVTTDQRAEEYLELDLNRLTTKRVFRGDDRRSFGTDSLGNIRIRQQVSGSGRNLHIATSIRSLEAGVWEEHFKSYAAEREGVGLNGLYIAADDLVYVVDNKGRDKSVVRKYDLDSRELSEPIFSSDQYEIIGLAASRFKMPGKSDVIGYYVNGPSVELVYTDPVYIEFQRRIDAALPAGQTHRITSVSEDMRLAVIRSSGAKEPGAYSLLVNGTQLVPLGRSFPNLQPDQLADMEFVNYDARDGLNIPAFLTIPKGGQPPYPTVIMPHGGPWARDYLGWDLWAQFLANRGYVVLQPQYRGSQGWGQKLWRAGDNEWGQKMQDDKDDGAKWLIEQGLADPERIAMYGYSYGGYAAMAATVRPGGIYQCAIAGAGLSELDTFDKITFSNPFTREYQNPTISGLSPHYVPEQAEIPLLIFHGDRDQRVPIDQSRKFYNALKSRSKNVKYLEIPDLWHSLPWFPQHHLAVLSAIEEYLADDCGFKRSVAVE